MVDRGWRNHLDTYEAGGRVLEQELTQVNMGKGANIRQRHTQ